MFPNPHDALPLPSHPNLEHYKKLAKDLVKAAASSNQNALLDWTSGWLNHLAQLANLGSTDQFRIDIQHWPDEFVNFVRSRESAGKLPLSKAQLALARAHGFGSWPKFSRYLDALAHSTTAESEFESAADAIVNGDLATLTQFVSGKPQLVRARSAREHQATLLHYTAANGVEGYRQKTPSNIVEIARLLLDSGADINAEANLYGGGSMTLELAATSVHPERTGVQESLMQLLIDRGASEKSANANARTLISNCLGNGRLRAAEFLAKRGFRIDLEAAAGLGLLDPVTTLFGDTPQEQRERALCWACEYGRRDAVQFLLERKVSVHAVVSGLTPLHWAVLGGHIEIIRLLLSHGADLEEKNTYGGTALGQALWTANNVRSDARYLNVLDALIEAGAKLGPKTRGWITEQKMRRRR